MLGSGISQEGIGPFPQRRGKWDHYSILISGVTQRKGSLEAAPPISSHPEEKWQEEGEMGVGWSALGRIQVV